MKGFYRACMVYARLRRRVINPKQAELLRELIGKLESTMRTKALKATVEEVERVVDEFRFWPRKTDLAREAVVQKLERYKHELEERRLYEEARALGASLVSANQKNKR